MSEKPRPIDDILQSLAEACCQALQEKTALNSERVDALVQALVTNGWDRHNLDGPPLSTHIEQRVGELDRAAEMHHPEQVTAFATKIEKAYQRLSKFESSTPPEERPLSQRNDLESKPPSTSLGS
jgi:hypothetical protein